MQTLFVYPSPAHVAAHEARDAVASSRGVSVERHAIGIRELETLLVKTALPDLVVIDEVAEHLLFARVLDELPPDGAERASDAWVRAAREAMRDLQQHGISPELLAARANRERGDAQRRLLRLSEWLSRADDAADALGVASSERAKWRAAGALRDGAPLPDVLQRTRIVIRHVLEFPPSRVALLEAVAGTLRAPAEVVIELPFVENGARYFRGTARLLRALEQRGAGLRLTVLPVEPFEEQDAGASIARVVLAPRETPIERVELEVIHAADVGSEARSVAACVRRWIDDGVPPERIAIAQVGSSPLLTLLTEALRQADVDTHAPRGIRLENVPVIRFLLDVLKAAEQGFPSKLGSALVSSHFVSRFLKHRGFPPVGVARRVLRSVPANLGGADELEGALRRLAVAGMRDAEDVARALSELRDKALPLSSISSAVEGARALRNFIAQLDLRQSSHGDGDRIAVARELLLPGAVSAVDEARSRAIGQTHAALDLLEGVLDDLVDAAERVASPDMSLAMFRQTLPLAMRRVHVIAPGLRGAAVQLVDLRDLAGRDFDVVVVPSLGERDFPTVAPEFPLLRADERIELVRAVDERRNGSPQRTLDAFWDVPASLYVPREDDPTLFLLGIAAAKRSVLLTRSRTDSQGRPVSASFVLDDAREALRRASVAYRERELDSQAIASPEDAYGAAMTQVAFVAAVSRETSNSPGEFSEHYRSFAGPEEFGGLADVVARVEIERLRMQAALDPALAIPSAFAGVLDESPETDARLARCDRGDLGSPFAATDVEQAAACPFRDMARRLFRTRPFDAAIDEPDPRLRGTHAHAMFAFAVTRLIERGLVPFAKQRTREAVSIARSALCGEIDKHASSLPHEPALVTSGLEAVAERVVALIEALYDSDDGFAPIAVEQAFGIAGGWPALLVQSEDAREQLFFRGRIDLVEARDDEVRISDLKSKVEDALKKDLAPASLGVTALQLPIYAAAAQKVLGARQTDVRYLSLASACPTPSLRDLASGPARAAAWKADGRDPDVVLRTEDSTDPASLGGRLVQLGREMRGHAHPLRPSRSACEYCDYPAVCRVPDMNVESEDS